MFQYVYFKNIFICAYLYEDFIVFLLLLIFSTLFFDAWQSFWGVVPGIRCVSLGDLQNFLPCSHVPFVFPF